MNMAVDWIYHDGSNNVVQLCSFIKPRTVCSNMHDQACMSTILFKLASWTMSKLASSTMSKLASSTNVQVGQLNIVQVGQPNHVQAGQPNHVQAGQLNHVQVCQQAKTSCAFLHVYCNT